MGGDPAATNDQVEVSCNKSEPVFVTENKNIFQTRGWCEWVNYRGGWKFFSRTYEANIVSNSINKDGKII